MSTEPPRDASGNDSYSNPSMAELSPEFSIEAACPDLFLTMFSKMFNQYQYYLWASAFLIISLIFNFIMNIPLSLPPFLVISQIQIYSNG